MTSKLAIGKTCLFHRPYVSKLNNCDQTFGLLLPQYMTIRPHIRILSQEKSVMLHKKEMNFRIRIWPLSAALVAVAGSSFFVDSEATVVWYV